MAETGIIWYHRTVDVGIFTRRCHGFIIYYSHMNVLYIPSNCTKKNWRLYEREQQKETNTPEIRKQLSFYNRYYRHNIANKRYIFKVSGVARTNIDVVLKIYTIDLFLPNIFWSDINCVSQKNGINSSINLLNVLAIKRHDKASSFAIVKLAAVENGVNWLLLKT